MSDEKSFPATDRRRREARESGYLPRSSDVCAASVIVAVTVFVLFAAPEISLAFQATLRTGLASAATESNLLPFAQELLFAGLWLLLPIAGLAFAAALLSNTAQVGFRFNWTERTSAPAPRPLMGLAYVAVIALAVGWTFHDELMDVARAARLFVLRAAIGISVLAVLDYFLMRRRYEASLALSPAEAADEIRQTEGDPRTRARRRQLHRRMVADFKVKQS